MASDIADIERQIEELAAAVDRGARFVRAGQASVAFGVALLAGLTTGVLAFNPVAMVAGFALAIGGVVLTGSSKSSLDELKTALGEAEALRKSSIDGLRLVTVNGRRLDG